MIKNVKRKLKKAQKGQVLIIAFLTMGILLILGSYFLVFVTTESKISQSQAVGVKTYYLAEAGVNEAIWKLKNDDTTSDGDPAWALDFIDPAKNPEPGGGYWSATFSKSNVLGGSYTVTIQNTGQAKGKITATATISFSGGKVAQRIVKTTVFKGLASPIEDSAVFTGGASENVTIDSTYLKVYDGNIFSNNNLNIGTFSDIEAHDNPATEEILEGQVWAANNLNVQSLSYISISTAICAKNKCTERCDGYVPGSDQCPPDEVLVPVVDFDSGSPTSFKSRAQASQNAGQCQVMCQKAGQGSYQCSNKCVFTTTEFDDLLWEVRQDGTLTLNNSITYVTGPIELRGGRRIVVNGALLSDDNIAIGERFSWRKGPQLDVGYSQITINQPTDTTPSGLLTKRKINFGLYSSFQNISITGVIYANDETKIISVPNEFNVLGGVIARKLTLNSLWQNINITLDNEKILCGLGYKIDGNLISVNPAFSPIITVEHWEESY